MPAKMKLMPAAVLRSTPLLLSALLGACGALPTMLFEPQWTYKNTGNVDDGKPNRFRQEADLQIEVDNRLASCKQDLGLNFVSRRTEKSDLVKLDACMAPYTRVNQPGCSYC